MKPVNQVADFMDCGQGRVGLSESMRSELTSAEVSDGSNTKGTIAHILRSERLLQFMKFCLVGGGGMFVDMGILYLLADPRTLDLNLTFSKICAAEVAMTNNFVWNEFWTFRQRMASPSASHAERAGVRCGRRAGVFHRFTLFNAFCGIGIALAVLLLHLFHSLMGWNLYLSNLLAITSVTFWNFGMNARFNWPREKGFCLRDREM